MSVPRVYNSWTEVINGTTKELEPMYLIKFIFMVLQYAVKAGILNTPK